MSYVIRLIAKNDHNGNPRRAWVLYSQRGVQLGFWHERYEGINAVPLCYQGKAEMAPIIHVTVAEYNRLAKGA